MMHKHGFQLQQVLNYRKEVEKARKLEFVSAKREYEYATELLQRHEAEADRARVEFNNRQATGISVNELQMYSNFFSKKTNDIQRQRCQVDSLGQEMSEKREVLLDAAKEKKSLELLKEKQLLALRREQAEKERSFLDELSVQRAVR